MCSAECRNKPVLRAKVAKFCTNCNKWVSICQSGHCYVCDE